MRVELRGVIFYHAGFIPKLIWVYKIIQMLRELMVMFSWSHDPISCMALHCLGMWGSTLESMKRSETRSLEEDILEQKVGADSFN